MPEPRLSRPRPTSRRDRTLLIAAGLLLLAAPAFANTFSPMAGRVMVFLLYFNFAIAIAEFVAYATIMRHVKLWLIFGLLAANFASAFMGAMTLDLAEHRLQLTILDFQDYVPWLCVGLFLAGLVFEWPFVWITTLKHEWKWQRRLALHTIIQSISISSVLLWVWLGANTSIAPEGPVRIVPRESARIPANARLYFNDMEGGISLIGPSLEVVQVVSSEDRLGEESDWFYFASDDAEPDYSELRKGEEFRPRTRLEWSGGAMELPHPVNLPRRTLDRRIGGGGHENFRWDDQPFELPSVLDNELEVRSRHTHGQYGLTTTAYSLQVDYPFAIWYARRSVQIERGVFIVQMGQRQICWFDAIRGEVALLALGRQPIVVEINEAASDEESATAPEGAGEAASPPAGE